MFWSQLRELPCSVLIVMHFEGNHGPMDLGSAERMGPARLSELRRMTFPSARVKVFREFQRLPEPLKAEALLGLISLQQAQQVPQQQGSLDYTPERCLVNGGFPLFWWKRPCVKCAKCIFLGALNNQPLSLEGVCGGGSLTRVRGVRGTVDWFVSQLESTV